MLISVLSTLFERKVPLWHHLVSIWIIVIMLTDFMNVVADTNDSSTVRLIMYCEIYVMIYKSFN